MKNLFLAMLLTLGLVFGGFVSNALAVDPCQVVGKSYTAVIDSYEYTLTDWKNVVMFSPAPRCGGVVSLVDPYGVITNLDWGVYFDNLVIQGFPAQLTADGLVVHIVPGVLFSN